MEITRNTSGAYHVQHAVCHVARKESSAVMSDRLKIAFVLALFYWLKHSPMEEGRRVEYPEKIPDDELWKMPHSKPKF